MVWFWLAACSSAPDGEAGPAEAGAAAPIRLAEVRLAPVTIVGGKTPRPAELRGLLTAALELGFSDLPGVVPVVHPDGVPLAFSGRRAPPDLQVDARATVQIAAEGALTLEVELCVAGGQCGSTVAEGTVDHPWPAVAAALTGAAATLEVTVPEVTLAAWGKPGSKDPYSELITGRSAAGYYGLIAPSLTPGDRKQDPVVRAVYLDPGQPIAQWMRARWEVATTIDGGKALGALGAAQIARPTSPLLLADQAALLGLTGHRAESLLAWETLAADAPDDPRWWLPLAEARLASGLAIEARDLLERLPASYAWGATVAELRVAAAEAVGEGEEVDPLLARWQAVDSTNPEPVRRRIDARVRGGEYAEAQSLVALLRARAPGPATDALDVALLVSVGKYAAAAERAPAELAARILARAQLEALADELPSGLAAQDPLLPGIEASVALAANDGTRALAAAERAVAASPRDARAEALRARALESAGRASEAAASWARAWELDPSLAGGPVEPNRIASTFRYVEAGVLPEALEDQGPVGAAGPEL